MVSIKVSAAGRPITIARGLPIVLDLPASSIETATVGHVKEALAGKYPQVADFFCL